MVPGLFEVCDGFDNNCVDGVDEGCAFDGDEDDDGDPDENDCVFLDSNVFYGQVESCNGVDDNCNGFYDEGFVDLDADGVKDCVDLDIDGDGTVNVDDCAFFNFIVYLVVVEFCNGLDDNCALGIDEGFVDTDNDGVADCVDSDDDDDGILDDPDVCSLVKDPD